MKEMQKQPITNMIIDFAQLQRLCRPSGPRSGIVHIGKELLTLPMAGAISGP